MASSYFNQGGYQFSSLATEYWLTDWDRSFRHFSLDNRSDQHSDSSRDIPDIQGHETRRVSIKTGSMKCFRIAGS